MADAREEISLMRRQLDMLEKQKTALIDGIDRRMSFINDLSVLLHTRGEE